MRALSNAQKHLRALLYERSQIRPNLSADTFVMNVFFPNREMATLMSQDSGREN
jgi:hypothetical protein